MKGRFGGKLALGIALCVLLCGAVIAVFSVTTLSDLGDRYRDVYREDLASLESDFTAELAKGSGDAAEAFFRLETKGFDGVALFSADGAVVASTDERVSGAFISGGIKKEEEFKAGGSFHFVAELDGQSEMFIFNAYGGGDYRLACFVEYDAFEKDTAKYVLLRVLEVLFLLGILAAFWIYTFNLWRHRRERLPSASPSGNYVVTVTMGGKIIESDDAFARRFGTEKIQSEDLVFGGEFNHALVNGKSFALRLAERSGEKRYLVCSAVEAGFRYKLVLSDMDEEVREMLELKKADLTDSATGFYREKTLEGFWRRASDRGETGDALIMVLRIINLDYFKILFGEDEFRKGAAAYADVVRKCLGAYGELFLMKNDDIVLLVTSKDSKTAFMKDINSVEAQLASPVPAAGHHIQPKFKYGVALAEGRRVPDAENFLYNGYLALKNALSSTSSNRYVLRGGSFDGKRVNLTGSEEIAAMLKTGQVQVMYQPQVSLEDGRIIGFEALTRLTGSRQKDMTTAEFIKACEQTGAIIALGEFVYEQAMDFACLVSKIGISVSVNVSPIQLMQDGFVEKFLSAYRERKLKDGSVAVEIVESTVLHSMEEVIKKLEILRQNGIAAHIDDFGVAYSSVLYLMKLPVTVVKLDKTLVDEVCFNEKSRAIVASVVEAAKKMGIKSLAESVETEEQRDTLREMGCDYMQGYLSGRAMPKDKAIEAVKEMANV